MNYYTLLLLLLGFQVKHVIADFLVQPTAWFASKHRYLSLGGCYHAGFHGVLSFVVLLAFVQSGLVPSWQWALGLGLCEMVLHYHIDWLKASVIARQGWHDKQVEYWWAFGIDQALHHLVYLAIAAYLVYQLS